MDEQIGTEGPTLRKAIGAPLLGIGALGIAISYVRNKRVREDKKAESDYYEAELYEGEGWTEKYGAGRKAYCGTCERLIHHSTRIYVNDSNGDIECADCYEYQQEADAETFCADKNCGCGQDPCKTYGAETFEATDVGKRMKCRSCSQWEFVKGVAMNNFLQDDKGKWRCYDCLYDKPKHKVVVIGRGKHKPFVSEAETLGAESKTCPKCDSNNLGQEEMPYCYNCGNEDADEDGCSKCDSENVGEEEMDYCYTCGSFGHWYDFGAETFEATPYGEEDMEYPVRIIVGGPPHSGKSTLMNLLEDKMNQYGVDVELRDLDFSSPTNLKAGFDPNRETKDWDEDLARDAASYFREDSEDKIVLGDSIGLISQINEIVSEPADVAILLVSGSKDQFDQSFRNALAKWKSYYEFIDLPILMIIRSSMNPNEMNYFDPHDNYGVIVGLDRDAYGEGTPQDNEISLENACLEGMVFEIAQEYDLELANRNTDKHIDTISEKWPNIEGKPTWNPIDAGKPHLGKIEDEYFSTFDERRKAKAMSAESFAVENDPDFDKVKADRNKDGEISDWEQSVGNAVAKGIREHGQKKDKSSSVGDMEHYMNMRWKQYTPSQKRDWFLMDLNYGHSNKNTKRYFKKGYEYGWNRAREDAGDGELLYMVARSKDLINSSIRKNGMFYDSGAWAGFEDSWRTYEGDEPIYMNNRY